MQKARESTWARMRIFLRRSSRTRRSTKLSHSPKQKSASHLKERASYFAYFVGDGKKFQFEGLIWVMPALEPLDRVSKIGPRAFLRRFCSEQICARRSHPQINAQTHGVLQSRDSPSTRILCQKLEHPLEASRWLVHEQATLHRCRPLQDERHEQ